MSRASRRCPPLTAVHVSPPSSVTRILPRSPTATPCCASVKCSDRSGVFSPVNCVVQWEPLSSECQMTLPGAPAIQTLPPTWVTAWKSMHSLNSVGRFPSGGVQLMPLFLVWSTQPPSPTSQPVESKPRLAAFRPRRPLRFSTVLTSCPRPRTPSSPRAPATTPAPLGRMAAVRQPVARGPSVGVQVTPPSVVASTPVAH